MNVPAPVDGAWTRRLRKAKWLFWILIAPEFILALSIVKRSLAHRATKSINNRIHALGLGGPRNAANVEMADVGEEEEGISLHSQAWQRTPSMGQNHCTNGKALNPWTLSHSYYANMGGIRVRLGQPNRQADEIGPSYYVTGTMLENPECPKAIIEAILRHGLSEDDIPDRSNGDPFTKSLAVVLVLSVIARKAQKIATSPLEIVTLAFAIIAVLIYAACWDLPQGVDGATIVVAPTDESDLSRTVDSLKSGRPGSPFGVFFYMSDAEKIYPDRVPNDTRGDAFGTLLWSMAIALLFGGLHCLAWNFEFPSNAERVIWRCASITSATIPSILLAFGLLMGVLDSLPPVALPVLFFYSAWILYVLARFALLTIAFTSLRSMPKSVYITTWAKYLPNVH